jgi:hypothetical protein
MPTVNWNKKALDQFLKAVEYIRGQSIQGSETVQVDISNSISNLVVNPEKFPLINTNFITMAASGPLSCIITG